MKDVVLVDLGGGNTGSVLYALRRIDVEARVSHDAGAIRRASHVIVPGVGSAAPAMRRLRESGLDAVLCDLKQPLLGICLGMQLFYEHSDEGNVTCLGLLPGNVCRMQPGDGLRIPHMGWNTLQNVRFDSLLQGVPQRDASVYFVHGYCVPASEEALAVTEYGGPFAAVVRRESVCGMQFHPERSGMLGARLLRNFLTL